MFTSCLRVQRGRCTRCGGDKARIGPFFVIDLTHGEPAKLVESEADNAACAWCCRMVALDIERATRIMRTPPSAVL